MALLPASGALYGRVQAAGPTPSVIAQADILFGKASRKYRTSAASNTYTLRFAGAQGGDMSIAYAVAGSTPLVYTPTALRTPSVGPLAQLDVIFSRLTRKFRQSATGTEYSLPFLGAHVADARINRDVATAAYKTIAGTVQDADALPLARTVQILRRSDMAVLDTVVSSAVDGSFAAHAPTAEDVVVICLPDAGDARNALIFDRITPL